LISITYTRLSDALGEAQWQRHLSTLPLSMQQQNQRFVQWKDRLRHLFGKLLLRDALMGAGFGQDCLEQLYYNEFKRPYIGETVDFNLSHSGDIVICAIATGAKVGVDVEQVTEVDFDDFDNVMTAEQWQLIRSAPDPKRMFFTCWAIKESMIKAESSGMSLPLLQIHINMATHHVCYGKQVWHVQELAVDAGHCTWVCSDRPITAIAQTECFYV
jgi:4'-phosphopantetheinyl transferase